MEKGTKKPHYSTWILVICILFQFFVVTITYHAPGQFVAPIALEMGIDRAIVVSSITVTTIASMVVMLFAGTILKKANLKLLFCISLFILGALYTIQSFATSVAQLYIIAVVRGIISPFCSMYPLTIVLNNWYGSKVIGRMLSYAMIGNSIGTISMNPVIGYIIKNYGWRSCYRILTFLPIIMIPIIAIFLFVKPEDKGLKRLGDNSEDIGSETAEVSGMTAKEAVSTSPFWFAVVMFLFWSGSTAVWQLMGPSFLTDGGRDPVQVASVLSVTAIGNLLGKIVLGFLYGKGTKKGLLVGFSVGFIAYILAILSNRFTLLAFAASFLFGFCIATVGAVPALVTAELFGRKDYGVISGFMQTGGSVGSSLLPMLMSFIYAKILNYYILWGIMSILVITSIILMLLSLRKKKEVVKNEV